jgi:hypothetical protein
MAETTAENLKEAGSTEEWETVASESGSPILFEVGTIFVGYFQGIDHIVPPNSKGENDEFDQAKFTNGEGLTKTINLGYKLREALTDVPAGKMVRITRMDDVPSNDPKKNDMKDYRVEVAK